MPDGSSGSHRSGRYDRGGTLFGGGHQVGEQQTDDAQFAEAEHLVTNRLWSATIRTLSVE